MMTVGVVSLGCSKNRVDTELMLSILQEAGYEIVADEGAADILIVNTCGFIEPAKQESIDTLLSLAKYKKDGKLKLLVATGCLTQRYEHVLIRDLPEVDLLMGVGQYSELPRAVKEALDGKRASYCKRNSEVLSGSRMLTTAPHMAYIRIADGCDNGCAYCAIPLIRGKFRSRSLNSVLNEIRSLAAQGVKEHILVAQDTSRFGMDVCGKSLLPDLVAQASDIPGVEWLRVLYCYPDEVDERLLDVMAAKSNVCKYLDLPLQHADPEVLRRMNRRGDIDAVGQLLRQARVMGFTLRTTFITGFPGETEAQFETLMDFVLGMRFDRLGVFAYSREESTAAAEMDAQIPEEIRYQRLDALMQAQQVISLERNRLRIGRVEKVLVEELMDSGMAIGRTEGEAPEIDGLVRISGASEAAIGEFITVRITGAEPYDLLGVML
ncbi:MAG: 30S ribosomal protein S12 methylthiotransferase RimO [Clostridia bacterium]|nr:30S ribosomal protein S12 methylthiotransferase RimO [Clostridia bacterium]